MIPEPLHPAVVHFPVVLVFLLPLVAIGAIMMIRGGARVRGTWALAFALSAVLVASAFVATRTGAISEEVVEDVVPEQIIEEHEEGGERFLVLAGVALALATLGFAPGKAGSLGRYATVAGSVVLVGAGWYVGHTGGQLVYEHGAAAPYVQRAAAGEASQSGLLEQLFGGGEHEEGEEDEDD